MLQLSAHASVSQVYRQDSKHSMGLSRATQLYLFYLIYDPLKRLFAHIALSIKIKA